MTKPFHEAIASVIEVAIGKDKVIRSDHCGGSSRLPLYYHEPTGDERFGSLQYSHVDLLIVVDDKVKGLVEIEESGEDTEPKKLFGNFMSSALSKCYIADSKSTPVYVDDALIIIQVLDTSGLNKARTRSGKYKTTKFEQWENVEHSIRDIISATSGKLRESKLKYKLFSGESSEFQESAAKWREFAETIRAIV